MGLKLKYSIEKKVREHNRKLRRAAKKLQQSGLVKKSKKDPGIPNICPYKKELLEELVKRKETEKRIMQAKQLYQKETKQKLEMETLLAAANTKAITSDEIEIDEPKTLGFDSTRKAFYKELLKVIEASDIILEVIDARDPEGTRSEELERRVLSYGNKRIALVLNKTDLVHPDVVSAWEEVLCQSFPVIQFRANTQQTLSQATKKAKSSETKGLNELMSFIKSNLGTTGKVGVVGYPNVGKSSIVNCLIGTKAAGVSSTPGFTRNLQEFEVDSRVQVLDCPGIVFASSEETKDDPQMVLRSVIKIDNLQDPFTPVSGILQKVDPIQLMSQYAIPEFVDLQSFLVSIARKRGKLRRGGTPDLESAAKIVLYDWVTSKIPYFTQPPNFK